MGISNASSEEIPTLSVRSYIGIDSHDYIGIDSPAGVSYPYLPYLQSLCADEVSCHTYAWGLINHLPNRQFYLELWIRWGRAARLVRLNPKCSRGRCRRGRAPDGRVRGLALGVLGLG